MKEIRMKQAGGLTDRPNMHACTHGEARGREFITKVNVKAAIGNKSKSSVDYDVGCPNGLGRK